MKDWREFFFRELCCDCLRLLSRCIKSDACHRVIKLLSFYCHASYTNVLCTLGASRKVILRIKALSKAHYHIAEKDERVTDSGMYNYIPASVRLSTREHSIL